MPQRLDGREVADKGEACPQPDGHPGDLGACLSQQLVDAPALLVQLDPLHAVAFKLALHPHEDLGVDRLRAGVAAPQAPRHGGEQEQGVGRNNEQTRQEYEVLRVQHQAKDVEPPRAQVKQNRLARVPVQPRQAVEQKLGGPHQGPSPGGKPTRHRAGVDLLLLLVHADDDRAGVVSIGSLGHRRGGIDVVQGCDSATRFSCPPRGWVATGSAHSRPAHAPGQGSAGDPERAWRWSCLWRSCR